MKGFYSMQFDYIKYKQIFEHLDDELSKHCFFQRILFTMSGNIRHIYNLLPYHSIDVNQIPAESETFNSYYHLYQKGDMLSFAVKQMLSERKLMIFGCGFYGQICYDLLQCLNIPVHAFLDNDIQKQGEFRNGIPILSPINSSFDNTAIIIAVEKDFASIKQQLITLNQPEADIYYPEKNWLLTFFKGSYFDSSVFMPRENEIFVDAGAYQGETAIEFSKWCPTYNKIYCFEPDSQNFHMLKTNLQTVDISNVECLNVGLSNESATLQFERSGDDGTGSHLAPDGSTTIQVNSLDNILNGQPVTYIKMDIEGAELDALEGAKETITKYTPRLAICIYHKPEDVYTIPLYLLSLVPDYHFKIRHYSSYSYDTILYAYTD